MKAKKILLFGFVLIWAFAGGRGSAPAEEAIFHSYSKPLSLPEIALEDLEGKIVRIQDQFGKVILLNFWATW